MLQATETTSRSAAAARKEGAALDLDLDALAQRSFEELDAMYVAAPEPTTLRGVEGKPRGRMLAVRKVSESFVGDGLRRFAGSRAFVWDGKTFTSLDDRRGHGINRVQLAGVLGRQTLFPFETRIGASQRDERTAILLDYDLAANPPYIRRIHDEVREVTPGLYLGPAMVKTARGPVTVLWFALDTRTPSTWT